MVLQRKKSFQISKQALGVTTNNTNTTSSPSTSIQNQRATDEVVSEEQEEEEEEEEEDEGDHSDEEDGVDENLLSTAMGPDEDLEGQLQKGTVSTYAGTCGFKEANRGHANGAANTAQFDHPIGIAFYRDSNTNDHILFVCDSGNHFYLY